MLKPMNQSTRLVSPRIDHTDASDGLGGDERTSGAHEIWIGLRGTIRYPGAVHAAN